MWILFYYVFTNASFFLHFFAPIHRFSFLSHVSWQIYLSRAIMYLILKYIEQQCVKNVEGDNALKPEVYWTTMCKERRRLKNNET
jgi:hypothetical protein